MTDLPAELPDKKEIAFEVWYMLAGRNAAETARILRGEPGPMEQWSRPTYDISDRTIRDWVDRYDWHDRADRLMRSIAPGIHAQVKNEIYLASVESMGWLRRVARGEVERPDKVQATVALSMLDRAGHLAETKRGDGTMPSAPTKDYDASVAGKNIRELAEFLGFDTVDEDDA